MINPRRRQRGLETIVYGIISAAAAAALLWPSPSQAEAFIVPELEAPAAKLPGGQPDDRQEEQALDIGTKSLPRLPFQRANLEVWARDTIGVAEVQNRFVGAGVVIFQPEGPIMAKGFGYGDFEKRDPIHPGVTYLPAAQLGNLLVAELLVDLERKGLLHLDDNADNYLTRIVLPPAYRHLSIRDLFGPDTDLTSSVRGTHQTKDQSGSRKLVHIISLLRKSTPEDVASPARSPLASALASFVVEDASGQKIENGLGDLLADRWDAAAWFNISGAQRPKYTSQHHTISHSGDIRRQEFYPTSPGFTASQGVYMTLNDMTKVLASQLKDLNQNSPFAKQVVDLAFDRSAIDRPVGGVTATMGRFDLGGSVNASSLHAVLIPDLEIGILVVVNSASRSPELWPPKGRKISLPPLRASDIAEDFLQTFIQGHDPDIALPPGPAELPQNQRILTSNSIIGSHGLPEIFLPLQKRSSANGLMTLFLLSVVLQLALLASAHWPAATGGQRAAKWLGMASVVSMSAALTFPIALLVLGHSRTLVDPLYLISRWAFPIAGLMAAATLIVCLVGWKRRFWGDESIGFRRRLCFTFGSLGVFGLAVVSWQLDLILPTF